MKNLTINNNVEYIQSLSTGTKAYWDDRCKHFVSENRRFHISLESALNRNDMYIHYNISYNATYVNYHF